MSDLDNTFQSVNLFINKKEILNKVSGSISFSGSNQLNKLSVTIENPDLQEDTKFHLDRYLPCLKIIYSPNSIDHSNAPFGYIKKTHRRRPLYQISLLILGYAL